MIHFGRWSDGMPLCGWRPRRGYATTDAPSFVKCKRCLRLLALGKGKR